MCDLSTIRQLYDSGLYLTAYERSQVLGPLEGWTGTEARVLAGQLTLQLGNHRRGDSMFYRCWRENRTSGLAAAFAALTMLKSSGPLRAWKIVRDESRYHFSDATEASDFHATRASVLAPLRDFARADASLRKAYELAPGNPWLGVVHASLLEAEDRIDESLEIAQRNVDSNPAHRSSIEMLAHALTLHNRTDEALTLLTDASGRLQSFALVLHLIHLLIDRREFAEVQRQIVRMEALTPLRDERLDRAIAGLRRYLAAQSGDRQRLLELLEASDDEKTKTAFDRFLTAPADAKRVELRVSFVRQHYQTCAPATLATISQYWSRPFEHLQIAERICYDGTPAHSERQWAEENGWQVREFTITEEAAIRLLDRGFPFTVTLVGSTHSHLCAAIGYDERLGSLLIRDPSRPQSEELAFDSFLESQASNGPRGMVFIPKDHADDLNAIELPDAPLYDELHRIQCALVEHDREAADGAMENLRQKAPAHRLTLVAERCLAIYDADHPRMVESIDKALLAFPNDPALRQMKLHSLRITSRLEERAELLKKWSDDDTDPLFWRLRAEDLLRDARRWPEARRLLKRTLRSRPLDAGAMLTLGHLEWNEQWRAQAVELYRFASCQEDKDQSAAMAYFGSARTFGGTEEAMDLLEDRYRRYGHKSDQPVQTLFLACEQIGNLSRAFEVLEATLARRPDDGELLLFAAGKFASIGQFARAKELLARSRRRASKRARIATRALIAQREGEYPYARRLYRELGELHERSYTADQSMARLLLQTEGPGKAARYLQEAVQRHPHDYGLKQLLVECLREGPADAAQAAIQQLLRLDRLDAWGIRELAMTLARSGKGTEAAKACTLACQIAPKDPATLILQGMMLVYAQDRPAAVQAFREALRLDPDDRQALSSLFSLATRRDQKHKELEFLRAQLFRPACYGYGVLAYASYAKGIVPDAKLLAQLDGLQQARSDTWATWSALISQLGQMQKLDRARKLAEGATKQFPYVPAAWQDLADVAGAQRDGKTRLRAARNALELDPCYVGAVLVLAETETEQGNWSKAAGILKAAVARSPRDARLYFYWADVLWKAGDHASALERIQQAASLAPGYDHAWARFENWCTRRNLPERPLQVARKLVEESPGDFYAWMRLGVTLPPYRREERQQAMEAALRIDPLSESAYDQLAETLAVNGCLSEAEEVCRPALWGDEPPHNLRGRAAWIAAERGDVESAITQMENVLSEYPDYAWGRNLLARWYSYAGIEKAVPGVVPDVEASRENPIDSEPADNESTATQKDRTPQPASLFSVDTRLASGDVAAAREQLSQLAGKVDPEDYLLRTIRLECAADKPEEALEAFQELIALPDVDRDTYVAAVGMLTEHQQLDKVIEILRSSSHCSNLNQRWAWSAVLDQVFASLNQADIKGGERIRSRYESLVAKMAKRWPKDPLANAYVAHVHRMKGNTAKAEQRLRRVLIADISNQYAARNLMDLLLEGGNFETAKKIVRKVADHIPANQTLCWQVTLAARQGQTGDAMRHFAKLCTCELDDMELTRRACDEMASHGMRRETLEIMEGSFTATFVNPCVGAIWVQTQLADKNARAVNGRLEEFSKQGRMGTRAISAYLGWLAQGKQRRSLRKCIDRFRSVLEADADAWGNVGNHLLEAEEIKRAEEWLYELQDRAGARPWMLYNLSIAQRSLKIASGYRELHARALRMQPDNTYPLHRELQAHEEALLGNVDAAIALRTGIDRPSLDTWIQHVAFLTDACIIAQSRARGEQEYTFRDITHAVASAKSVARPSGNTILEWMHVRALKSIVHVSGPRGFAWYVGQRIQSSPWVWSIVIGAIVAILRLVFLKK